MFSNSHRTDSINIRLQYDVPHNKKNFQSPVRYMDTIVRPVAQERFGQKNIIKLGI